MRPDYRVHADSNMMFATPQAFGDEGQYQRIEGHTLGLGARSELGMNRLGHAGDELARRHPSAVGSGYRKTIRFQGGNRRLERVMAIGNGLLDGFAVGNALRKISVGNQVAPALVGG